MNRAPHIAQELLAGLTLIVTLLILMNSGWIFIATITGRPGLQGSEFAYYSLSKGVYGAYQFIIATMALLISLRLIFFLFKNDRRNLVKTLYYFIFYVALVILCELYLETRVERY